MISYKIEGLTDVLNDLKDWTKFINPSELDNIVHKATTPLVNEIKNTYNAEELKKTGTLIDSISAFQRKRKGNGDPYFTYYVGPKWGNKLFKGGNHAALLEYGTVERFRANTALGGVGKTLNGRRTGISTVYGATIPTGRVMPYGVLRKSTDQVRSVIENTIKNNVSALIIATAQKNGYK